MNVCYAEQGSNYDKAENWPLMPRGVVFGQVTGVAINSKNQVFIFHRASRDWLFPFPKDKISEDTIHVFDGDSGRFIKSWGKDTFIMPHGLSVDSEDNVWVSDAGSQQVYKFSSGGQLLLSLGDFGIQGAELDQFGQPTDIEVLNDKTVLISDGYINSRIVRYSPQGKYLSHWGVRGAGAGEFNLPHGISSNDKYVYVADRSNSRVQIFDHDGAYVGEWGRELVGRPFSMDVGPDNKIYVINGGDFPDKTTSQIIILTADGKAIEKFSAVEDKDARNLGHDIAVGRGGAIYVADAWSHTVRKFLPKNMLP